MISAMTKGDRDFDCDSHRRALRNRSPSGMDPSAPGSIRFAPRSSGCLKANVPQVKDQELILRTRIVVGMLNWLVLAPVGTDLRSKSRKQLERLVVRCSPGRSADVRRLTRDQAGGRPGGAREEVKHCLTGHESRALNSSKRLINLKRANGFVPMKVALTGATGSSIPCI